MFSIYIHTELYFISLHFTKQFVKIKYLLFPKHFTYNKVDKSSVNAKLSL